MNAKLPNIAQMHGCNSDRERADVLLRCPDAVLLKYSAVFDDACRRVSFEAGRLFIAGRLAVLHATRNAAGGLPGGLALELETMRAELTAFAAGAPVYEAMEVATRPPP
jgi:hypothetical protein